MADLDRPEFQTIHDQRVEPDAKACVLLAEELWDLGKYDRAQEQLKIALRCDRTGGDKRLKRLEDKLEADEKRRAAQGQLMKLSVVDGAKS